ncbi:MAG: hypothetical protein O9327_04960 [Polaromonas sp.]|nr:hypothetical protein [Polaromonas sp.]
MLQLVGCQPSDDGAIVAKYNVMSAQAATDETAAAPAAQISLTASVEGCKVSMRLGSDTLSATEDEALNALADQLEAAAKAIRGRGECKFGIPVFG